jgi:hypothetical protein
MSDSIGIYRNRLLRADPHPEFHRSTIHHAIRPCRVIRTHQHVKKGALVSLKCKCLLFSLYSHLLAAFISLDLSNALFHEPLYLSRQWPLIPLLPYSSIFYAPFNNQPRHHEFAKDRLIQRGNVRTSYFFLRS